MELWGGRLDGWTAGRLDANVNGNARLTVARLRLVVVVVVVVIEFWEEDGSE